MTAAELVEILRNSPTTLAFDTNFLRGNNTALKEISASVTRANERLAPNGERGDGIQLRVPALVHAERVFQIRRSRGTLRFSAAELAKMVDELGFVVSDFTQSDAEGTAGHLFRSFPDDASWKAAKKGKGSTSATVDWFIAGQIHHRGWIIVTDDKGVEWAGLRKVGKAVLLAALDLIIHDPD